MKFNLLALAAIVSLAVAAPVADNAVVEGAGGSPGGKPWKRDGAVVDGAGGSPGGKPWKRDDAVTEGYPGGKDW
ncbi:hypothetical protein CSIM01_12747 [Colletotrichum simmondsii]|uniref:Uncharacterized protein n=1 Tax=Colletotrichum simmondsii TaxID=703756 RepID=A0A135TZE1_9PEZI|nr:hypothetical protein CSIM01_12747 [Colletotrichum simmondsii]